MKLLIVDDETEILNMLRRNFTLRGYEVTVADDPLKAMEYMKKELFNLVLSDIRMPGLSGIELLKKVKELNPLANVIMMTGYSSMENVVACLGTGAVDYFVKPFADLEEIMSVVDQARDRVERWRASIKMFR